MGKIQPGSRVLIVDDVVTYGSALANLRGWLERQGATVVGTTTLATGFGGTKLALPHLVRDRLLDRFPAQAEALANELGFSAECFTRSTFSGGAKKRTRNATAHRCRPGIDSPSRAPAILWDTRIKSTHLHTHDTFQDEFVRQAETAGNQISDA